MIDPSARIHATAGREADVSVGPGTSVWHRAQVRTGARIGRDGVIGRDVFFDEGVTLDAAFADLLIQTPMTPVGRSHVFHQYTIAVDDDRDGIVADHAAAGVGTRIYYPVPVHRQPYVVERGLHADLPMTDRASLRTLSLPMFPGLTDEDQTTVFAAVRAAVERRASGRAAQAMEPARDGVAAP